jgi:hypothetical protein
MSADRITTGIFALILSLEVKFINMLQKNKITEYSNTRYKIPPFLSYRFKTDHYGDIVSGGTYNQRSLNVDSLSSQSIDLDVRGTTVSLASFRTSQKTQSASVIEPRHDER